MGNPAVGSRPLARTRLEYAETPTSTMRFTRRFVAQALRSAGAQLLQSDIRAKIMRGFARFRPDPAAPARAGNARERAVL